MGILRYLDAIASTPLFQGFQRDEMVAVLHDLPCSVVAYKKGSILHLVGDICTTLDLILEGEVSLQSVDQEGNSLWIQQVSPGELIGAGFLFAEDNHYPMMAVATSDVTSFSLSKDAILSLCRHKTEFTLAMFQEVARRTAALTQQLHSIAYQSIRYRLTRLLLRESSLQKSTTVALPTSQKQIAEHFGVQRQSISRELNKMRKEGLLEYQNRTIHLQESFFAQNSTSCE